MVENILDTAADVYAGDREVSFREITEGVYFESLFSGVTAFETTAGLVLVDTGPSVLAEPLAEALRDRTDAPVATAIYTHGHVDHAFGLGAYLGDDQSDPEVVAHEAILERFERYERTRGHNAAINARQFGGTVDAAAGMEDVFGTPEYPPTRTYRTDTTVQAGATRFEISHGKGETDDHSWVWCPDREVCCPGDFFIGDAPNAGNPQKVQRYPTEWAATLRAIAEAGPRHLCPGHGGAIVDDPDGIERRLLDCAAYLQRLVADTLEAMNSGSPPHVDILQEVDTTSPDVPWLEQRYDEAEFVVRNVIRRYGGWWTGRPSELKPASRERLATELADLCDGPEQLVERAEQLAADGEYRLACHLADYALEAAPDDEPLATRIAALYRDRADGEASLMSQNLFRSAAAYAEEGRPFR